MNGMLVIRIRDIGEFMNKIDCIMAAVNLNDHNMK